MKFPSPFFCICCCWGNTFIYHCRWPSAPRCVFIASQPNVITLYSYEVQLYCAVQLLSTLFVLCGCTTSPWERLIVTLSLVATVRLQQKVFCSFPYIGAIFAVRTIKQFVWCNGKGQIPRVKQHLPGLRKACIRVFTCMQESGCSHEFSPGWMSSSGCWRRNNDNKIIILIIIIVIVITNN